MVYGIDTVVFLRCEACDCGGNFELYSENYGKVLRYLIYLSIYYHIHNQKKVLINFKMEAGEAEAKWDCILFVSFRFEALQKADSNV